MATKLDTRQSVNRSALSMVGSAANEAVSLILPKIDAELAKLFEDRNITLVDGGVIAFPAAGTSVTFTTNLKLHVNSQVAGGSPTIIDLAATTRTLSADLKMIYAVINRTAGTAVVTDDSSTLPAQTSANQEVVLIAKRIDSGDGTKRVYFRGGFSLSAGQSARYGTSGHMFASEFAIVDATDTTKKIVMQASGSSTGTSLTLAAAITANRVLTLPDITDTLVSRTNTETLSNKQVQYSVSTDSTTTGSDATLQSFNTGVIRLTNASLASVGGIPAGSAGQFLIVENKTGNSVTVQNEDSVATAADRIQTGSGGAVSMANNATFAFTYDTTSSRWQLTGGSGSGSGSGSGKNYLSAITTSQSSTPNTGNGNFELGSTIGWSLGTVGTLTNGIPTGTPTFGSGASGNLSISTISSGQLAGSYSLSYASSAATTQGNMLASDAFYIDTEDQAKVLGFKFYYKAQTNPTNGNFSGTSSNSFAVAAWDVTNSSWLSLAGNFGMTQNSGVGVASGTFQTASNTTQIRFVMYNANASAGAITMYFDDFFVGPQIIPQSAVVTDWLDYTAGLTAVIGTIDNNAITARWRRVGGNLEVVGSIGFTGTPSAFNVVGIGIPSGLAIDLTKISSSNNETSIVGEWTATDVAVFNYGLFRIAGFQSSLPANYVLINDFTNTSPFSFSTGDKMDFKFSVPIVGWSSNVQMSNDTDTRVVALRASKSSTQTLSNATYATILYPTISKDTHGSYNTSTGIYTAPISGFYSINAQAALTATNTFNGTTETWGLELVKVSGTTVLSRFYIYPGSGLSSYYTKLSDTVYLDAGDQIFIRAYQDSGGSLDINGIAVDNVLSIERLSGPSVIAASETVAAKVNASGGTTIAASSSDTKVQYNTVVKDTHGAFSTVNNRYTAPISGWYSVSASVRFDTAAWTAINRHEMLLYKNGVSQQYLKSDMMPLTSSYYPGSLAGTTEIYLLAGDYLEIFVRQAEGTTRNLIADSSVNFASFVRVGN